jgi:hypothetical protein
MEPLLNPKQVAFDIKNPKSCPKTIPFPNNTVKATKRNFKKLLLTKKEY